MARIAHLHLGCGRNLFFFEQCNLLLVFHQGFNAGDGGTHACLHHVFGQLFFIEDYDFFDVAHAALQVLA